jgi:hypothetical protein
MNRNIFNDFNLNMKEANNRSSELLENQNDPATAEQEPDEQKKNYYQHGTAPPPFPPSTILAESAEPMHGNRVLASPQEEGTGKPSKRPLPAHSVGTSTCIHPLSPSAPPTDTPTIMVLLGNQEHEETQNDANEAPTEEKGIATASIPASENSNQPGTKDERRERNRVLARRRRERKKTADEIMKERIDEMSTSNELLRSKNRALIQELVSLGFDVKTVMDRLAPNPPASRRRSGTNANEEDHHTIEVPSNIQSAETTSNQHQVYQQHQLQHQQHPNHQYQNLLSLFLGRTSTGNAFAAGEPPPSQLSSTFPILPHQQQWLHSSIHTGQHLLWQQQQAMLLGSGSNNGQQTFKSEP